MDDPVKKNFIEQEQHYRLQLLAQAIEKVENDSAQKKRMTNDSSTQSQEFLMQLLTQQNMAAVMAAAAAAAAQLQLQQQKSEPISPPSTSSASSSTVESPIDFSSRRSIDEPRECSSPANNSQLLSSLFSNSTFPFLLTNKNGKPTRPFKAYPRDPLMLPLGYCSNSTVEQSHLPSRTTTTSNRKRLTSTNNTHFISSSGAQILQPPKKRHRTLETSLINEEINQDSNSLIKDEAYWERRRKNNEAAKRSRDARRVKEDEIAIRAALLEQENLKLRLELSQLKQETAKLRCMIQTNS